MVPLRGSFGVTWALRRFSIAFKIVHRMPEYPCIRVLVRTSMAALVVDAGRVFPVPLPNTPAFKNLVIMHHTYTTHTSSVPAIN